MLIDSARVLFGAALRGKRQVHGGRLGGEEYGQHPAGLHYGCGVEQVQGKTRDVCMPYEVT